MLNAYKQMAPEPDEIKITREEFQRLWGYVPPADCVGCSFASSSGAIFVTYRFVGSAQEEITELERLAKLC